MNIPTELKYTKEHEWIKIEDKRATIGITDYAQGELGDIVFVELPTVGEELTQMKPFGTIEAVKSVSDIYAPVSGKVVEVNSSLDDEPMSINKDPYGDGWIIKIEMSDPKELEKLLDADGYKKLISAE